MRFLPFVQCSNRSRGWGFALRPCLRNVRDMHWTGPRCPCKMIFLIQNLEFLILAKLVIQNLESYLLGVCAIGSTFLDSEPRWILEIFYKSNEGGGLEQVTHSYHYQCLLNWLYAWSMPLSAYGDVCTGHADWSEFHNLTTCSPHNPTGKVFSKEELLIIAQACQKMDCFAITDEVDLQQAAN